MSVASGVYLVAFFNISVFMFYGPDCLASRGCTICFVLSYALISYTSLSDIFWLVVLLFYPLFFFMAS